MNDKNILKRNGLVAIAAATVFLLVSIFLTAAGRTPPLLYFFTLVAAIYGIRCLVKAKKLERENSQM